jgi:hypothetical protein
MSAITIRATFALAIPIAESGPVWSAMTPTFMANSVMFTLPSLQATGPALLMG